MRNQGGILELYSQPRKPHLANPARAFSGMLASSLLSTGLALIAVIAEAKPKPRDAILLSEVASLTLRADRETSHRRAPAAPQLKCVSSRAICSKYKIDTLRCENKGSGYDSEDIQWSCSASLPPELKLGSTDVICEGYSSPQDPYVLKGSCGVEYRLVLTREGEERWPDLGGGSDWGGDGGGAGLAGYAFWVIFFAVLAFIIYNGFINARGNGANGPRPRRNNGNNFWGTGGPGGGDDDGDDDPPPPYPGTNNNRNSRANPKRPGASSSQQGWRPDFWSAAGGAAAGAAAAYGAGRMGRNNNTREDRAGFGGGNYGSTWGSGGAGPSRSGSSGSSSGSGVSSSRHESTGFGSTSRR